MIIMKDDVLEMQCPYSDPFAGAVPFPPSCSYRVRAYFTSRSHCQLQKHLMSAKPISTFYPLVMLIVFFLLDTWPKPAHSELLQMAKTSYKNCPTPYFLFLDWIKCRPEILERICSKVCRCCTMLKCGEEPWVHSVLLNV